MNGNLKIALAVSILLNVFLLGAGASALWFGAQMLKDAQRPAPRQASPLWAIARDLDPALQGRLKQDMRTRALATAPEFRAAREARARAAELAAAPAFDRAAVAAELERARASELAGRTKLEQGLLDFMQSLKPEDRARLAPALKGKRLAQRERERRRRERGGPDRP